LDSLSLNYCCYYFDDGGVNDDSYCLNQADFQLENYCYFVNKLNQCVDLFEDYDVNFVVVAVVVNDDWDYDEDDEDYLR